MTEINTREIATELMLDAAREVKLDAIWERLPELPEDDRDRLVGEIDELISTASVVVEVADDDGHVVDLRDDGWTIKHPLSCRPHLFDCPVNLAAERDLTEPQRDRGRFACRVDDVGRFVINEKIREVSS